MDNLGKIAFIAGLVICAVAGVVFHQEWFGWVLAVLGLVVGFLNVSGKESHGFLLAAVGLMLSASSVQNVPFVGGIVSIIVANLVVFMAPAVLVVACKSLFDATSN